MKRKMLFVLSILILSVAVALSVYYFLGVSNVVEWLALVTSYSAAVYAIVTERNPIETERQKIYGKLKRIISNNITILEEKKYRGFSFDLWGNIQKDQRYEMFDENFARKLDVFLESTQKYSSAINKLETFFLPKIIKNTAKEVFAYEPEPKDRSITLSMIPFDTKGEPLVTFSPYLINCLKTEQSLLDLEKEAIANSGVKETEVREIGLKIHYLKAYEPLNLFRQNLEKNNDFSQSFYETINLKFITIFWEKCLQEVAKLPEHQYIVNENDKLLEEAKGIKEELIKRIKKSMEK